MRENTSHRRPAPAWADATRVESAVAEAVGFVAGAIGLSVALPQALRIRKVGTFGVSRITWMATFIVYGCWLGYGIRTDSPSQMTVNVIALLLSGWLLMALLAGERWKWPFLCLAPVLAPVVIMGVPDTAMTVILLSTQAVSVPQIVRSWRAWREKTPIPAVSNLTWILVLTSSVLWLAYALIDNRPLVIVTGLIAIVASSLILILTRLANRASGNDALVERKRAISEDKSQGNGGPEEK